MKSLCMLISLVFLCCIACQQGKQVAATDVEADIQVIRDSITELNAAVNAGDFDRIMPLLADDIVVIRPNEPALIGKEANRRRSQQEFDELALQDVYEVKNIDVSCDLGVAHIAWSTTATPKTGGEPIKVKGNWIFVFKKHADDTWKIIYSIWSDENLVIPPPTQ